MLTSVNAYSVFTRVRSSITGSGGGGAGSATSGGTGSALGSRGVCVLSTALGGEFTQTQLASLVGIDKTMMMVTVDELERLGLAERRQSENDRREDFDNIYDFEQTLVNDYAITKEEEVCRP